jgi:excinuclease ABC subunit C
LTSVKKAVEKQQIAGTRNEDYDVIGLCEDELEASVQVFYVRNGRVLGQRGFIVDKVEPLDSSELTARVMEQLYHAQNPIGMPKLVVVPHLPEHQSVYEEWLSLQRGSKVTIRVAQRGHKRALHDTAARNAQEMLKRHRLKRGSDHNSRAQALNLLQEALSLPQAPLRIECYDMSHLQGTDYVGSMVVLEDGLPRKSEYRRFKIRTVAGNDDFAAMEEVLRRRFLNYLNDRDKKASELTSFSYPPQLLLVDGGKGQLSVAVRVLKELGLFEEIPVAALAKQFEEVFLPGKSDSVRIPRQSEALYLLQRIRDESHRFAISYHRQLRDKRMTGSILDGIPGLGEKRKRRLIEELGGVKKVKSASMVELEAISWLPQSVAQSVYAKTHMRA